MADKRLLFERHNDIIYLKLNVPPANQTDSRFFPELGKVISRIRGCSYVQGVIISGIGRHFSSGADIDELQRQLTTAHCVAQKTLERASQVVQDLAELPCPVVAAISGCCIGSGLELALGCDYRIATPKAFFSLPEVTYDFMPGCGGTVRLPALVGLGNAIEMILTGRGFLADTALSIGLIDQIAVRTELPAKARRMLEVLPKKRNLACFEVSS